MKKRQPTKPRGSWNGIKPVTRMTPTKKERIRRAEKKHRRNLALG